MMRMDIVIYNMVLALVRGECLEHLVAILAGDPKGLIEKTECNASVHTLCQY